MASSSSEPIPESETSQGARYRLTQTLCFDEIRSKFAERETVLTDKFYCQYDPVPTEFRFSIKFGNIEEEYLGVYVLPVSRAVFAMIRIELFDDRCKLLSLFEKGKSKPCMLKKLAESGSKFHKFDATAESSSSWRLVIDLVYFALPDHSSVIADQPKLRLQEEFGQLLESGEESDVTFIVQGEKIKAHKIVLTTRCEVFKSMFGSGMEESFSKEVDINDIEPKAFRQFLRFLYTNMPPKYAEDSTMELLAAADKYCVDDLRMLCEGEINFALNKDNVVDALILAEKHHCPTLMTSAKAVFGWHAKALKSTNACNKLLEYPKLLLELLV